MSEAKPPARIATGKTDRAVLERIRIVDERTGESIDRVIEADAGKGTLTRYKVEDGHLVREGDKFATVDEERAIRFEWIEPEVDAAPEADA